MQILRFRPPPRRVRSGNKEEEIKEVVRTFYFRKCYFRKCKRIRWSPIECIPDEVLFEILVRLPAQEIYYESRLVCRKWYHMMRTKEFIHKHLERASCGLLYRDRSGGIVFISAKEDGGIHRCKLNYKFRDTVWSSCNGLMLEHERLYNKLIYNVANVSTGQAFRLPPFPFYLYACNYGGIGYDAASMTYKVVVSCLDPLNGCAIFTVGVDKAWRKVRTDHVSSIARGMIMSRLRVTQGFVHWNRVEGTELLTLNLETEIITGTPPPIPKAVFLEEKTYSCCVSTEKHLSLFLPRGKLLWEVFEMKPETMAWRKLPNICLQGQNETTIESLGFNLNHDDFQIMPRGWLKYPEVLVFFVRPHFIIFYNLITREIGTEKLTTLDNVLPVTLHKNSLVSLGGP